MKITKHNSSMVARWLLQCDHEDFNGPLDLIAEQYLDLYDIYRRSLRTKKNRNNHLNAGNAQMTLLTRTLFQHLSSKAKEWLEERMAFSKGYDA